MEIGEVPRFRRALRVHGPPGSASGGPRRGNPPGAKSCVIGRMGASSNELYEAVLALSRSIAGRTDLDALVSGVATSLRRIVRFDHVGLVLHDANGNVMQGYILNEPSNPVITRLRLPVDQDLAGWVWLNQQPLVISHFDSETRWQPWRGRMQPF